jgi:hypothetical protein
MQALGGSGHYKWNVLNQDIAVISGTGLVRSKEVGSSIIMVQDSLNSRN